MAKRTREAAVTSTDISHDSFIAGTAHTPKYVEVDEATVREEDTVQPRYTMQCSLPPHETMTFVGYAEYEAHYVSAHTNRCEGCHRNFPSSHFLDLHLAENHDPFRETRRERGEKIYACFVEGCNKVCSGWEKRRRHLVDKHAFPRNYDFLCVNTGIDGKRSLLRSGIDAQGHRKSSREWRGSSTTETTLATQASGMSKQPDDSFVGGKAVPPSKRSADNVTEQSMESITKSMSSLQFVPRSITFGKRKGKTGFAKS